MNNIHIVEDESSPRPDRIGFEARGRIDREDWGLTWSMTLDSGGLMVSQEIHVELVWSP
ncbi:MAG: hypothetical protein ACLFWM_04045 [Actinomycetota bacterium]